MPLYYFDSLNDAVEYARNDNCKICGVEILDQSLNVVKHPSHWANVFFTCIEGDGLRKRKKFVIFLFISHIMVMVPHH